MKPSRRITRYSGISGPAVGWLLAQLHSGDDKILVICRNDKALEELRDDLSFFTRVPVITLPSWDVLPFEPISPDIAVSAERLASLWSLGQPGPRITLVAAETLQQRIMPREVLSTLSFEVHRGSTVDRGELIEALERCGFRRTTTVEGIGDYAVRGGVIDLFPATVTSPIRLTLLDTLVEQVRLFDLDTQRSVASIDEFTVVPVRELVRLGARSPFHHHLSRAIATIKARGKSLETPPREIARAMGALRGDGDLPGIEALSLFGFGKSEGILQHLVANVRLVLIDEIGIRQTLEDTRERIVDRSLRLEAEHYLTPPLEFLFDTPDDVIQEIESRSPVYLDSLELLDDRISGKERRVIRVDSNVELSTKLATKVGSGSALEPLRSLLTSWRRQGFHVAFVVGSRARGERLHRLLLDIEIDAPLLDDSGSSWCASQPRAPVVILSGHLSAGFQLPSEKLVFIAEHEIFHERSYRSSKVRAQNLKRILSSLAQLKEGDFVVHADYGIGIYRGLKHITLEDSEGDFLHIEYADTRLFLPVHQIGRVQKFVAAEGQTPQLDKLASNRWLKTKAKVKESVATLAGDLIKLYASRSVSKGWRFEPWGAEDERFADGFAFSETPDQLKAIEETVSDMAADRCMDRLVCGDVGFGKTEVAIRAAFKCTQHTRQVAVLVPTTILVEQHKRNFQKRFEGSPIRIEAISRFYHPRENKRVLEGLAAGDVDIIIGTHRLLSQDVQFSDLGLVVIDEEHRFGVKQKEKLKSLKRSVDVLTLTATPIPRTLHMSLLGIRDISVITTPPQDRRVIRTYIASRDDHVVRDAILRELQRGGQAFFVHNRVQSIDLVTHELKELIPEARFRYAHGQMSETELEEIMREFLDGEIDVLVSTTIIESGLDIPNANTIIIDRADTFGLAQLYQLRGRVGRSTRQAYAYFLVPKARKLTGEAQMRLKALQSLDELGLGFNLAMRDMEIRGAGNLLGKEQSGNVLAVGFELYSKILKEAILHLKGEELDLEESIEPEMKLGGGAYVPEWYLPDVSERLILYQRLSALSNDDEVEQLSAEIEDRFGPAPQEVAALLELMRYRSLLRRFGIVKAEVRQGSLLLAFSRRSPIDIERILDLVKRSPERFRFSKHLTLSMKLEQENPDISLFHPLTEALLRRIERAETT